MKNHKIAEIEQYMIPYLDNSQMEHLHEAMMYCLQEGPFAKEQEKQVDLLEMFLAAKRVEGCSIKTVHYYNSTIRNVVSAIEKDIKQISTDDVRTYLVNYQTDSKVARLLLTISDEFYQVFSLGLMLKIIFLKIRLNEFIR